MKFPDFNGFYVRNDPGFEVYFFHFIQENEFVKTTHVMTFLQDEDYCSPYKVFYESSADMTMKSLFQILNLKR